MFASRSVEEDSLSTAYRSPRIGISRYRSLVLGVAERVIVVRNALLGVGADHGFIEKLPLLVIHVGDQQAEKMCSRWILAASMECSTVLPSSCSSTERSVCRISMTLMQLGGCRRDLE